MSAKEIAVATLDSEPCRTILTRVAQLPMGKKLLNKLSQTRGVFSSFEEGWSVARKAKPAGHEHPSEIDVHLNLAKTLRSSDYAVLYWLLNSSGSNLKIFDFGGNVGNLYYSYAAHLKERIVEWTVFDLPPVLKQGEKIAKERGAVGLRFTNSVEDIVGHNVLLVSGSFHYWEGSVEAFLEQFSEQPEHVLINRTPVHSKQPSFVTVQCRREFAFPCIVRNENEIVLGFANKGYTLVDRWPALELAFRMPLFPDRSVANYSGLYFRRIDQKLSNLVG
jgi:putative methyltransferase (TIGR04325 family)